MLENEFPRTLAAARAGGEWAWASIYQDLAPSVLGYLRKRGAADPEDLTGEVFLQVVRDLGSFDGNERDFRAWVFTIAHHRLLDDARRRARRPLEQPSSAAELAEESENAEEEAWRDLASDRVREIIDRLSPEQRDVLLLRILGDLTVNEVAGLLGKSAGAVKALQRRGLEAVQSALAEEGVTL
jgi:RNA polymerase sigma factor (sigma-70 family)